MTTSVVTSERELFEVEDGVAYFNTAALAPLLRSVRAAGEAALARRAKPWTIGRREWFDDVERLRHGVATLMGVDDTSVALVPSSSYGLATVARNISVAPGSRVLVLGDEFPSNYHTWLRFAQRHGAELVVVEREPEQSWTDALLTAIDERVAVASLPNVHWTNGSLIDLQLVSDALHRVSARFVIDASQSFGAHPLSIDALRPDAVVCVGYKWLLGPYSLGYLYVDAALQDGEPLEENWIVRAGSDDFSSIADYQNAYRDGAQRYDVGERSNFTLAPMALAGIDQLQEWKVEHVAQALRRRTDQIAAGLTSLGLNVDPSEARGPHLLGVRVPADSRRRVAAALEAAQVFLSVRGSSLRIAPHLHTNDADVEQLIEAMRTAL